MRRAFQAKQLPPLSYFCLLSVPYGDKKVLQCTPELCLPPSISVARSLSLHPYQSLTVKVDRLLFQNPDLPKKHKYGHFIALVALPFPK